MGDGPNLTPPAGVTSEQLQVWACSYLAPEGGVELRKGFAESLPKQAAVLTQWSAPLAVAVHSRGGAVQFASGFEAGWSVAKCHSGWKGKSCQYLRDKMKMPVAFPRSVLTVACNDKAGKLLGDITSWAPPAESSPADLAQAACFGGTKADTPIARANQARRAAASPAAAFVRENETAVNQTAKRAQIAAGYTYGWKIESCPDGAAGSACGSVAHYKSVTLPTTALTLTCPTAPKVAARETVLIPLKPDPRPWKVEYNSKGGHDVIIDLDTIGVVRDSDHRVARLRFVGVNGPECKGQQPDKESDHYHQRCINADGHAEWGADQGREALVKILAAHGNTVYLAEYGEEGYGRLLATVFVKNPDGSFLDVNAELVRQGMGMIYFIAPDDPLLARDYLPLHLEARRAHRGLYGAPPDIHKYRGPLNMPSYHPKASSKPSAQKSKKEYTRIFNTGTEPVQLGDTVIVDARTGEEFPLPAMMLPVGFGVQVFPASGETNADLSRPLVLNLGRPEGVYWRNDSALLLKKRMANGTLGPVITAIAGSHGHSYLPDGF